MPRPGRLSFRRRLTFGTRRFRLHFPPRVLEYPAGPLELKIERPELEVPRLVRAIHLVDVKIRVLLVELLDPRR